MSSNLCRICDSEGTHLIFEPKEELYIKLNHVSPTLNIKEGDGLPTFVCDLCEHECQQAYQFVLKCEAAGERLCVLRDKMCVVKADDETEISIKEEEFGCLESSSHVSEDFINIEKVEIEDYTINDDPIICTQLKDQIEYDSVSDISIKSSNHISKDLMNIQKVEMEEDTTKDNPTICTQLNDQIKYDHVADISIKRKYKKKAQPPKQIEEQLQCPLCGNEFVLRRKLINHLLTHRKNTAQCPVCTKVCNNETALKYHIRRTHCGIKFVCESCGKEFSKNALILHRRTHTGEKPFSCSICPQTFTQQGSLLQHERRHKGIKMYSCTICNKAVQDKHSLKLHSLRHTNEKNYPCNICNKSFKTAKSLKVHNIWHLGENVFPCKRCGKIISTKGNLKSHAKICIRSGKCSVCKKTVPNLEVHMRKHTGEIPFKCEFCPKSYTTSNGLAHHISFQHKSEGRFKCTAEDCEEEFRSKPMLEFHMLKIHTRSTPYKCSRCSRAFYRLSDLNRHVNGTHK